MRLSCILRTIVCNQDLNLALVKVMEHLATQTCESLGLCSNLDKAGAHGLHRRLLAFFD